MRGIDKSQEQKISALLRDTRTTGQKISGFFDKPKGVAVLILITAAAGAYVSAVADILLIVNFLFFVTAVRRKQRLPFRMPQRLNRDDFSDINPGTGKPRKGKGIYFFGNDKKNNEELWFTNDDMRTHVLIFGSTGSGKTVALTSIAFNALVQGSGFIYVDGKGDNTLYANIFSMVRYMGREDDMLLINFMTGARDIIGPQEKRISNTMNPFATGSSGMLSNLISGMMESGGSSGDGDMWKGRAIAFVEALMKVLVAMRDAGHILLDANAIRNYFALDRIEAMAEDKAFIRDGQYAISLEGMPSVILEPITNYLSTLPGYNKERKGKQVSQVFEQHGYITMQLTRVFTSLADTYGHILRTKLAEVDLRDVVLNRRIMVVLLPALEKSPDELSNLGKVIISSLKSMMAAGLGDSVEGSYQDLILKKPTNADTPFLCVLDEYGYYAVKGFAVVPAQARSLGFSVVFAGQDLPAFQKASKEEAASIGANTNIKICMKLEDPTETWDFFMKTAGEAYVTTVESFNSGGGNMAGGYMDSKSAKAEKRSRIDLLDLKDQGVGEAHFFFQSNIVRARFFFANPQPCQNMRLNQMTKVDLPKDQDLYRLVKGIEDFEVYAQSPGVLVSVESDSILDKYISHLKLDDKSTNVYIISATQAIFEMGLGKTDVPEKKQEKIIESLTIFSELEAQDILQLPDGSMTVSALLSKSESEKAFSYIERLVGKNEAESKDAKENLIMDLQLSTMYRKSEIQANIDVDVVNQKILELVEEIQDKVKGEGE
jgi:intracellular multiplication protein IcmO